MRKGVTLKDIARRLNMSVSTVSKALSSDTSISNLTRERVSNLALEWGYVPNESARNFALKKSLTIGLIIPDLNDQFFVAAINGVEEIAEKENYNIILGQSHEDVVKEEKISKVMMRSRIDGLILAITKDTFDMSIFEKFKSIGIPVLCMIRQPNNNSFHCISIDNKESAFKATNFLIEKGHQRIAHIMGPEGLQISQLRLEGYKQALQEKNITIDPELIKVVGFSQEETEHVMAELMALPSPPTGIFTFKNYITLDAIEFLKKNYPQKLSSVDFADFGNLSLFHYLDHKPAASIDEDFYELGKQAALLLFKIMNDETFNENDAPKDIKISCELITHGS